MKDKLQKFLIIPTFILIGTFFIGLGLLLINRPKPAEISVSGTPILLSAEDLEGIGKINLNSATQSELETLPDIGPKTAMEIINYRLQHNNFGKIEEIMNVKGIGPKTFEKIKRYLEV